MTDTTSQQPAQPAQPAPETQPQPQTVPQVQADYDEKFFAAIGYFGPLFILTLIAKPKSAFCKFHAKQSMILLLVFFGVLIVLGVISRMIGSLLTLALFAVYVIAIYRAYMGDMWRIPLVSEFAGKMDVDALYGKAGVALTSISGLKEKAGSVADKATQVVKTMGKQEEEPPAPPSQPPSQQEPPAA